MARTTYTPFGRGPKSSAASVASNWLKMSSSPPFRPGKMPARGFRGVLTVQILLM
ncbi:hypothetical protein FRUB_04642 [Fimbriiglobus ruber]|uniref:Uncharacterized protein n=1 Tax=Fimbriiglobus ruber TaxID=1908690 RepID=A0A225DVQ0_9BACT|nr:hypothetical protein FRUB_04642 [Fimbriiglobus ruber]